MLIVATQVTLIAEDGLVEESSEIVGALVGLAVGGFPALLFGMLGVVLLRRAMGGRRATRRAPFPTRWRFSPPPPRRRGTSSVHGQLQGEVKIRAPLTGRWCLGYSVGVRTDDAEPDRLWSWSLLVDEASPSTVDGIPVPPRAFLDLEPRPVPRLDPATPQGRVAARWLRAHGLLPDRPGYELYEAVLEPGEHVELRTQGERSVVVVR